MSESGQRREPEGYAGRPDRGDGGRDPDVRLDIPKVSVDSIRLAVDGLDADLSLRARVANLLQLDAGVRVHLQGVELDIAGVHAEAQLTVRLEKLVAILDRTLRTIDENPQIIETLSQTAGTAIDDVNRSTQQLAARGTDLAASTQRLGGATDDLGQQVGAIGGRARQTGAGGGPGRPGPSGPQGGQWQESQRQEGQPREGQPREGQPQGRQQEGQRREGPGQQQRPEGQRPQAQQPAGAPSGQGGGGPQGRPGGGDGQRGEGPGGAQAAAQSAAQLAEQAGETLRQAGRSVWEAIQGGMAQHRQQGRRDQ